MNTLKYKGYIGSVDFREEDGTFLGKVLGTGEQISFTGESLKKLTTSFHKAVDNYIKECAKSGINPKKTYSGTLNIRISPLTHSSIAGIANASGITINAFIKRALEKAVKDAAILSPVAVDYDSYSDESGFLKESAAVYGKNSIAEVSIPSEEIPFAEALAAKLGWKLKSPLTESEDTKFASLRAAIEAGEASGYVEGFEPEAHLRELNARHKSNG